MQEAFDFLVFAGQFRNAVIAAAVTIAALLIVGTLLFEDWF